MIEVVLAPEASKEQMWKLFREYALELSTYDGEPRPQTRHHYPVFDQYWEKKTHFPFLVLYDHEPIGFCLLEDTGLCYQINEFYIRPLHRRRGFGKMLMEKIKEKCIELGRHRMLAASIYVNNEPALKFWNAVGFKDTGRRIRIKNLRLIETEMEIAVDKS